MFCSRVVLVSLVAAALAVPISETAVAQAQSSSTASPQDAKLADLSKRALETWLALNPVFATQIGSHKYDSQIDDFSVAGRKKIADSERKLLGELSAIEVSKLTRENQIDAAIL